MCVVGTSRVASDASSRLIRMAMCLNVCGVVVASRSTARASWTSGCSTQCTGTRSIYRKNHVQGVQEVQGGSGVQEVQGSGRIIQNLRTSELQNLLNPLNLPERS